MAQRQRRSVSAVAAACLAASALLAAGAVPAQAAGSFVDDDGNHHEGYIEAIVVEGITAGCSRGPTYYCPDQDVRRDQMASFLARALALPDATRDYFADDAGNAHEANINRIAEAGITLGDGTGGYRPLGDVRRDQMASFLSRALLLPAPSRDYFFDDAGSPHEDNINRLAEAGVTLGDGAGRYSPTADVRRDQMASFLGRALGLQPTPPGTGPTQPPAPEPEPGSFGGGTKRVGTDVSAGTYRSGQPDGFCYWERLSGFSGEFEDVIANGATQHRTVVTIESSDAGFDSDACGTWSDDLSPITSSPTAPFDSGTFIVGTDVAPGTYRSGTVEDSCYWERLAGFSGEFDELIANDAVADRTVATIKEGDVGFDSDGCGTWSSDLSPITSSPTAPFAGGTFIVGTDIAAGTWQNSDSSQTCYWERLSGFSGEFDEVIANDLSEQQMIVEIAPGDAGFSSDRCGTWAKIG